MQVSEGGGGGRNPLPSSTRSRLVLANCCTGTNELFDVAKIPTTTRYFSQKPANFSLGIFPGFSLQLQPSASENFAQASISVSLKIRFLLVDIRQHWKALATFFGATTSTPRHVRVGERYNASRQLSDAPPNARVPMGIRDHQRMRLERFNA